MKTVRQSLIVIPTCRAPLLVIPTGRAATRRNLLRPAACTLPRQQISAASPPRNGKIFLNTLSISQTRFDVFIERGKSEAKAIETRLTTSINTKEKTMKFLSIYKHG